MINFGEKFTASSQGKPELSDCIMQAKGLKSLFNIEMGSGICGDK